MVQHAMCLQFIYRILLNKCSNEKQNTKKKCEILFDRMKKQCVRKQRILLKIIALGQCEKEKQSKRTDTTSTFSSMMIRICARHQVEI